MTSPDPDALAEIAGRLTPAQRRAFYRSQDEDMHEQWAGHISCWADRAVAHQLYALKLIERPETLARATPLGVRVRAYLISNSEGKE